LILVFTSLMLAIPSVVAQEMEPASNSKDFWKVLEGLDLSLKTFDNGEDSTLGIAYSIDRSIYSTESVFASLFAKGNVAFDDSLNPEDLLETKLKCGYRLLRHGISESEGDQPPPDESGLEGHIGPAWILDLNIVGGLESDQAFTQKQWTYGLAVDAWVKVPEVDPLWWNVADYPGSLIRYISGHDRPEPRGGFAIPVISVGLDQVEVQENDPRASVGDESSFSRLRMESSMRTPLLELEGDGEVSLSVAYRWYSEIAPSDAVEAAELDEYDFFSASVFTDSGFYIRYTTGMLPFDQTDTDSLQIGWTYSIDAFR
jgi:hypothetical protein